MWLRQGTIANITIGIVVYKTALPVEDPVLRANIKISKNGSPKATKNDTSNSVYDGGGDHIVTVNAVDTGTLGRFRITIFDSSGEVMLGSWEKGMVVPQKIYDYFILGTGSLDSNMVGIMGTALDVDANGRMAKNFSTLLINGDADTTAIIDLLKILGTGTTLADNDTNKTIINIGTWITSLLDGKTPAEILKALKILLTNKFIENTQSNITAHKDKDGNTKYTSALTVDDDEVTRTVTEVP